MAHELSAAFFKPGEGRPEGLLIQPSGESEADKMVRHADAPALAHTPVKAIRQSAGDARVRRRPVQRQPHEGDLKLLREPNYRPKHAWNNVGVFM